MDGWKTRGRHLDAVRGLMWHHTASPKSADDDNMLRMLRDGHSTLSGPLYQTAVTRDGVWHLVAAGRANHAGRGSWSGLSGNGDTLGLGAFHEGTSAERWNSHQLASMRVGAAAICDAYGIDPLNSLLGHKEWAPRRKIDPYDLYMPNERRNVNALLEIKEAEMAGETSNPAFQEAYDKAVAVGVFSEHTRPLDDITAEKLAVFLDRAGVLDGVGSTSTHDHDSRYAAKGHGHTVPNHKHAVSPTTGGVE